MPKLEQAINIMIGLGATDRYDALKEIHRSISLSNTWLFAKQLNLLDEDRSCEEFAIEYMTAYNNEVKKGTY